MAEAICSLHGKVDAIHKEGGVSKKTGKAYGAFWACPLRQPTQQGFCKLELSNTPSGKFDQSLDKAASQMDASKKDATITRIAIAKSLIEAGRKYGTETLIEAQAWEAWINGQRMKTEPPQETNTIPF